MFGLEELQECPCSNEGYSKRARVGQCGRWQRAVMYMCTVVGIRAGWGNLWEVGEIRWKETRYVVKTMKRGQERRKGKRGGCEGIYVWQKDLVSLAAGQSETQPASACHTPRLTFPLQFCQTTILCLFSRYIHDFNYTNANTTLFDVLDYLACSWWQALAADLHGVPHRRFRRSLDVSSVIL